MTISSVRRVSNLELRWTATGSGKPYPEIVQWRQDAKEPTKEWCFTLCNWFSDKESWNLRFIGDRPFDYGVDAKLFWALAKYGQKLADAAYEFEEVMRTEGWD